MKTEVNDLKFYGKDISLQTVFFCLKRCTNVESGIYTFYSISG